MSEEIKKEAQDVELNPEDLDKVAGGEFVIIGIDGHGNEHTGKETKCTLCGKTFLSFGSNYCDTCTWIREHGISE